MLREGPLAGCVCKPLRAPAAGAGQRGRAADRGPGGPGRGGRRWTRRVQSQEEFKKAAALSSGCKTESKEKGP